MSVTAFSSRRVVGALASSLLGQALTVGQNYVLVPLFLAAWGNDGYGRYLSLTALASYLGLLDLGGQSFVGNALSHAYAQNRLDDFRATLREGLSIFAGIGIGSLSVVGALLLLLPSAVPWDVSSRIVIFCSAALVALSIPGGVLMSCYPATGRVVRSAMLGNVARAFSLVVSVWTLRVKVSSPMYAIALLANGTLFTGYFVWDLHRSVGNLFEPKLSISALRRGSRLLRGSIDYWMMSLAGALNLQGILLLLASTSDNSTVALFSTHRAAASLTTYIGSLLRPALWTEMTFMAARSDTNRLRDVVSVAVRAGTWCAAVAGSAICLAAPFGYALWTRSTLELDIPLLVVLTVQAVLSAAWNAASWPLMSANKPRLLARWSIANAVITIVLAYLALRQGWGVWSVAAASLLADVLCGLLPFPYASAAFLGESVARFALDLVRALLCAVPFAVAAYLSIRYLGTNLARMTAFASASAVLLFPALLCLFGPRELARIRTTILKR